MKRYEFKVLTVNRNQLRDGEPAETKRLNDEGAQGWRIVTVRDDPRDGSHLVFVMERELD
jgi:hypothetical protein